MSAIASPAPTVHMVRVEGAIGPAVSDYFVRAVEAAQDQANAVLMTIDTPGGLDQSMREMVKAILASRIPVIAYVSPNGSRAASAGTYLVYASHIAAMAPATNIGSSTPVQIGGRNPFQPGSKPMTPSPTPDDQEAEVPGLPAMERKIINDAAAYMRSLAQMRSRNADWAEQTVRQGDNLTAQAALQANVIDLIATDISTLLTQVDGRRVTVNAGNEVMLDVANAQVVTVPLDWRHQFLATITDPNIAYLMLMIGLYGLIIEFYSPGVGVAGVVGVACLLLGGFALQMLPINYAGLGLMLFGIALMIGEAVSPSVGVLGVGGVACFVLGSVLLMDTSIPGYRISLTLIGTIAATSVGVFIFTIAAALRMRSRPPVSGASALLSAPAVATEAFVGLGHVRVGGEVWQARSSEAVQEGQALQVTGVDGLILTVIAME